MNRICTNENSIDEIKTLMDQKIDYSKVDEILKEARTRSLMLLKNAIEL